MEKITYTKAHHEVIEYLNIDRWCNSRIDVNYPSEDTLSKINEVFVSRKTFKTWDNNNIVRAAVKPNKKYKVRSSFATCFEVIKIEEGKVLGTGFVGGTYERDFWIDREDISDIWLLDKDADNLVSKLENVTVRDHMLDIFVKDGLAKISLEPQT
jgi:hypothetical protein